MVQVDYPNEVNELASVPCAKNAHRQKATDWQIKYLERSALREFDGNLERADAEKAAWQDIIGEWVALHGGDLPAAKASLIALGLTLPSG